MNMQRPAYFAFLPAFLFRPESPIAYILKAWPLVLLPSMLLSALVNFALPSAQAPDVSVATPQLIWMLVLGAPLIETAIMLVPLLILNRLFGAMPAAVLSAIGWGIAHSLAAPIWGLVVWWPFLIFSIALIVWKERSLIAGYFIVSAVHALQNGFAALLLIGLAPGGPLTS
jgi:hypothetical protein